MNLEGVMIGVVDSLIYSLLGIVVLVAGYKIVSWVVPFDLNKELHEDDNTAVGVFMAGIFIAIGLIIAASISGESKAGRGGAPRASVVDTVRENGLAVKAVPGDALATRSEAGRSVTP